MLVAFVLMLQAIVFYVLYAQMPTSLNFFAIYNVRTDLFGIHLNPVSLQALNPFGWSFVAPSWLIFIPLLVIKAETLPCQLNLHWVCFCVH